MYNMVSERCAQKYDIVNKEKKERTPKNDQMKTDYAPEETSYWARLSIRCGGNQAAQSLKRFEGGDLPCKRCTVNSLSSYYCGYSAIIGSNSIWSASEYIRLKFTTKQKEILFTHGSKPLCCHSWNWKKLKNYFRKKHILLVFLCASSFQVFLSKYEFLFRHPSSLVFWKAGTCPAKTVWLGLKHRCGQDLKMGMKHKFHDLANQLMQQSAFILSLK